MSNLNWPEGATHYLGAGDEHTRFRDLSGENWKFFNALTGQWSQHYFSSEDLLSSRDLIPRPQPKPWSGPEDGLPPVGVECEVDHGNGKHWDKVTILAHHGEKAIYLDPIRGIHYIWGLLKDFRTIRTPEQRAAEKRETAIRELMDIAQVDCRVTAARLVDAGFKREGV